MDTNLWKFTNRPRISRKLAKTNFWNNDFSLQVTKEIPAYTQPKLNVHERSYDVQIAMRMSYVRLV